MATTGGDQVEDLVLKLNRLTSELQATRQSKRELEAEIERLKENYASNSVSHGSGERQNPTSLDTTSGSKSAKREAKRKGKREGDLSQCPVRHVALKLMYTGSGFHGFASQAGNERTVEAELFAAFERTRLLTTSRCQANYSRCGRTDKGVSALGQVIALGLRSKCRNIIGGTAMGGQAEGSGGRDAHVGPSRGGQDLVECKGTDDVIGCGDDNDDEDEDEDDDGNGVDNPAQRHVGSNEGKEQLPFPGTGEHCIVRHNGAGAGAGAGVVEGDTYLGRVGEPVSVRRTGPAQSDQCVSMPRDRVAFAAESRKLEASIAVTADAEAEIDYVSVLNRVLPVDIRILGWCPVPEGFSARFSCLSREYKYFFVNHGNLDIQLMREAAAMFVGEHDFRNFCKMDASNVHNYRRCIHTFSIVSCQLPLHAPVLSGDGEGEGEGDGDGGGYCYYMHVKGTAFLWHQVRCMAAVLFMVGRREEHVSIVGRMLDLNAFPRKPQYAMAPQHPLLLFQCNFQAISFRSSPDGGEKVGQHIEQKVDECLIDGAMLQEAAATCQQQQQQQQQQHGMEQVPGGILPRRKKTVHVCLARRPTEPSYEERNA